VFVKKQIGKVYLIDNDMKDSVEGRNLRIALSEERVLIRLG
jgi:hypothetical protein